MLDASLEPLWRFEDELTESASLGWVGLTLFRPLQAPTYLPTPTNSSVFATTGGDGVHFSFLDIADGVFHYSTPPVGCAPVVMTVPCFHDCPNLIVGESLLEFLSLGCFCGYDSLEELLYSPTKQLTSLQQCDQSSSYDLDQPDWASAQRHLLAQLRGAFDLTPWADVATRLFELQVMYLGLLRYSREYTHVVNRL